jgi:hypothetical protein
MCRAGTTLAVPLSAGFFSELLLRDDLTQLGHPDRGSAHGRGRSGRRRRPRRRPAPRGFPRPGHGGVGAVYRALESAGGDVGMVMAVRTAAVLDRGQLRLVFRQRFREP